MHHLLQSPKTCPPIQSYDIRLHSQWQLMGSLGQTLFLFVCLLATGLFNTKQSLSSLLRWLTTSTARSASKLEFGCWPSLALGFLLASGGMALCRCLCRLPLVWILQVALPPDCWAMVGQSQDSCGAGWQARSQGAGGGNCGDTGCARWWGTSRSVSGQTVASRGLVI